MSKVLEKLIDINALRELKKKLVGTDSVYVQTAAVDQTVAGTKTFSNGVLSTDVNAFMAQRDGYTLVLRNDGRNTFLLMSDKDGVPGTYSSARPLTINNSTGVCDINGNAGNGVDSSGSGWIRFKNGIQICTGTTPLIYLDRGEYKIVSATFPKSFNTAPNVITCSTSPHVIASTWGISLTGCEVYLKSTSSGDATYSGRYIAFGTWK